jgi:hypothetical protein
MRPVRLSALLGLVAFAAVAAEAQPALPRTPDGHPDFQGVWTSRGLSTLERPPGATALVVDDTTAAKMVGVIRDRLRSKAFEAVIDPNVIAADSDKLTRVNGEWRTSWITEPTNGKLPLTAEGRRLVEREFLRPTAPEMQTDPEARSPFERCLAGTGIAPLWTLPIDNIRQIVQTPDSLVIWSEQANDVRIVGISAEHRPAAVASWLGDSVARWEGDVLVVETVNENDNPAPSVTMPQSVRLQSRIVERFNLVSANEIRYRFTIEDPALYSAPWNAEFSLNREDAKVYEYSCHEGNTGLPDILRTARLADAKQAAMDAASEPRVPNRHVRAKSKNARQR